MLNYRLVYNPAVNGLADVAVAGGSSWRLANCSPLTKAKYLERAQSFCSPFVERANLRPLTQNSDKFRRGIAFS